MQVGREIPGMQCLRARCGIYGIRGQAVHRWVNLTQKGIPQQQHAAHTPQIADKDGILLTRTGRLKQAAHTAQATRIRNIIADKKMHT